MVSRNDLPLNSLTASTYANGIPKTSATATVAKDERTLSPKAVRIRSLPKLAITACHEPRAATYWYRKVNTNHSSSREAKPYRMKIKLLEFWDFRIV